MGNAKDFRILIHVCRGKLFYRHNRSIRRNFLFLFLFLEALRSFGSSASLVTAVNLLLVLLLVLLLLVLLPLFPKSCHTLLFIPKSHQFLQFI